MAKKKYSLFNSEDTPRSEKQLADKSALWLAGYYSKSLFEVKMRAGQPPDDLNARHEYYDEAGMGAMWAFFEGRPTVLQQILEKGHGLLTSDAAELIGVVTNNTATVDDYRMILARVSDGKRQSLLTEVLIQHLDDSSTDLTDVAHTRVIVAAGADIHVDGERPLRQAAYYWRTEDVKFLCSKGADFELAIIRARLEGSFAFTGDQSKVKEAEETVNNLRIYREELAASAAIKETPSLRRQVASLTALVNSRFGIAEAAPEKPGATHACVTVRAPANNQ